MMCSIAMPRLGTVATESVRERCSVSNASVGAGRTCEVKLGGGGERCESARREGGSQRSLTEASSKAPAMRGHVVVRMDS